MTAKLKTVTPASCGFYRRVRGRKGTVRCGQRVTHVVPDYFVVARKGHRDAFACTDCAARLRSQGLKTRPLAGSAVRTIEGKA